MDPVCHVQTEQRLRQMKPLKRLLLDYQSIMSLWEKSVQRSSLFFSVTEIEAAENSGRSKSI